jgi:hypothetical protein
VDQAGNKLSETGEKIGDAVEGAKAKIGDAVEGIRTRRPTLRRTCKGIAHDVQDKAGDATALISSR